MINPDVRSRKKTKTQPVRDQQLEAEEVPNVHQHFCLQVGSIFFKQWGACMLM